MNLLDIVYDRKSDESIAIKQGDREVSYMELWKKVNYFSREDYGNSDKIAILIDNSIEFVIAFFSLILAGKIVVLIDASSKAIDIVDVVDKCNIEHICSVYKFETELADANLDDLVIHYFDEKPKGEIDDICNNWIRDCGDEVAIIIPTSGTTSERKYVQLTHDNVCSNLKTMSKIYRLKEGERGLLSLPMTSMFCLTVDLLASLYAGMCVIIYEGVFSPKLFIKQLQSEMIDYFITVPAVLKSLCALKNREYFIVDNIKRISIGGEKATVSELNEFYDTFKNSIIVYGYGMTECSPVLTTTTLDDYREKAASVGRPLENVKVKIVDSDGNEQLKNTIGEIIVTGPNIMKGYLDNCESIINKGWLKTGDIGYLDEDGYLFVTGRIKNLIISAGKNVSPEEIESALLNSGLVSDIRVRGMKNDVFGEMVVSDVVLKKGTTVEDVKSFCIEHLASYKVPKKFFVRDKIEKTSMNKIDRKV